jgi:hypothetical protein
MAWHAPGMHRLVGFTMICAGLLGCASNGSSDSGSSAGTLTTLGETGNNSGDGDGDGEPGDGDGDGDGEPGDGDGEPGDGDGDDVKFDVGPMGMDLPEQVDACKVSDNGDGAGPCEMSAPADSFAPVLQWSFTPNDGNHQTLTTPLVANLTDDNQDGEIDLCDIPDVVLLAFPTAPNPGNLYVLDGETGSLHYRIPQPVNWRTTPAVGDIDADGVPEILVQSNQSTIYCFEHDGSLKWESQSVAGAPNTSTGPAIALADIDVDGDVEIIFENLVLDHDGALVWSSVVNNQWSPATVAADLDGDDLMELIHPTAAFRHDGSLYYSTPNVGVGFTAVANMDDDDDPEIVVTSSTGISVIEHDGSIKFSGLQPAGGFNYARPPAVHDMNGDDIADFAVGAGSVFAIYNRMGGVIWSVPVDDASGSAGSTAFDFLGDNGAEAMYGDENFIWAFEQGGVPVVQQARSSATVVEYPVVADVDNDGSAEILIGSSHPYVYNGEPNPYPTLQVFQDAQDRWIQARRIWNQHTYHVSNVREDGTIPQYEPKHWLELNTFRTNAQIENGGICDPVG